MAGRDVLYCEKVGGAAAHQLHAFPGQVTHAARLGRQYRAGRQDASRSRWARWRASVSSPLCLSPSGCKAEESRLRSADRLTNLISVFCILSWRIFWLTMIDAHPMHPLELR
ncbi:MAG: hypothetical protein QOG58_4738 [Caballeronia sp.]|nr:hypothetical protein [Caballeronia sp.]